MVMAWLEIADDTYPAGVIVTRAEWQAAVDALNAPKVFDWPEGATHKFSEPTTSPWRDLSGVTWKWFGSGIWRDSGKTSESLMANHPNRLTKLPIPEKEISMTDLVVEWGGEGDPPVGIECEWHLNVHGWVKVKILGRDGADTWYRASGEEHSQTCRNMAFFRPIRTAEQVAAEERESGIQAIQDAYTYTVGHSTHKILHSQATRLYDAGCRLQVAP